MFSAPSEAELELAGARLGEALLERGWRLATAESSTGGLIWMPRSICACRTRVISPPKVKSGSASPSTQMMNLQWRRRSS